MKFQPPIFHSKFSIELCHSSPSDNKMPESEVAKIRGGSETFSRKKQIGNHQNVPWTSKKRKSETGPEKVFRITPQKISQRSILRNIYKESPGKLWC